jgi:hypothetical protein
MKRVIAISATLIFINCVYASPDSKLITLFNQTFPSAQNIKWHDEADGYVVFFAMNGINNRVCYNYKDDFISCERYYSEENLPAYILFAVKKKYDGKQIFGVTEITNQSSVSYHILLKDDKKIYDVNVSMSGSVRLNKTYLSALNN